MQKITVGSIFFLISAILFSAKYISTSILLSHSDSLSFEDIKMGARLIPFEFTILYLITLVIGIVFFILGVWDMKNQRETL